MGILSFINQTTGSILARRQESNNRRAQFLAAKMETKHRLEQKLLTSPLADMVENSPGRVFALLVRITLRRIVRFLLSPLGRLVPSRYKSVKKVTQAVSSSWPGGQSPSMVPTPPLAPVQQPPRKRVAKLFGPRYRLPVIILAILLVNLAIGYVIASSDREVQTDGSSVLSPATKVKTPPPKPIAAVTDPGVLTPQPDGSILYRNDIYHFSLSLPSLWSAVTVRGVIPSSEEIARPSAIVVFELPSTIGQTILVLQLRVDDSASHQKWLDSFIAADPSKPAKQSPVSVGQTGEWTISTDFYIDQQAAQTDELRAIATSLLDVYRSFKTTALPASEPAPSASTPDNSTPQDQSTSDKTTDGVDNGAN